MISIANWQSIFWINLPIGLVIGLMSLKYIPDFSHNDSLKIDLGGMILSFGFMFCIILGLIQKESHQDYSWFNWHISLLLIGGIVLIILFAILENKITDSMLDLSMLKNRAVIEVTISNFALGISIYAFFSYIIMLLQNYMGYSTLQSGSQLMVISAFSLILGPLSGFLARYIKSNSLIVYSLILAGVGMLTLPLFLQNSGSWLPLIPAFVTLGIANDLVNPLSSGIAVNSVTPKQVGMVADLLNVGKRFGTSLGLVVMGLTLTGRFNGDVAHAGFSHQLVQRIQTAGPASAMNLVKPLKNAGINQVIMDHVAILGEIVFLASAMGCAILFLRKRMA